MVPMCQDGNIRNCGSFDCGETNEHGCSARAK